MMAPNDRRVRKPFSLPVAGLRQEMRDRYETFPYGDGGEDLDGLPVDSLYLLLCSRCKNDL